MPDQIPPVESTPIIQPVSSQEIQAPSRDADDAKDASDTFSALNKLFDEVVPQSQPEPPKTQQTPTPVGTQAENELDKKLQGFDSTGSHPNVAKGMDELKKISREEYTKRVELETKYKDLETKVADYEKKIKEGVIPDQIQKELEETRQWRREMDLRNDVDFQKQYVQPVQEAESTAMSLLKQAGLKEDTVKFIEENGGIIAMSQSDRPANDKQTLAEWVNDVLLPKTPLVFRNRIISKLTGAMDAIERGNKELSDWQSNSKERWEAKQTKQREDFIRGRDKTVASLGDLAKPQQAPVDATPEQRASIESHNNRLRLAEQKFQEYLQQPQNAETHGEILVKATQADVLLAHNKDLQQKLAAAEKRISEIKASGSHSQAGSHTPPPGLTKPSMQDLLKQTDNQALGKLLDNAGITR